MPGPRSKSRFIPPVPRKSAVPVAPSRLEENLLFTPSSFDFSASQILQSQRQTESQRTNTVSVVAENLKPDNYGEESNKADSTTNNRGKRNRILDQFKSMPTSGSKPQMTGDRFLLRRDEQETAMRQYDIFSPAPLLVPGNKMQLRSVDEIPSDFRNIFNFPYFNVLQSTVIDEVLYTDKSVVLSAPTGSGKTAVFELAIVRLLLRTSDISKCGKIIYMSPMKSLCSERHQDWSSKFEVHGLKCLEVTGDSEMDDFTELFYSNLICTTPEKWDSMSRRWKDNKTLFQQIQLFLIDEVHILNDSTRGATVEAVVSRMKTLQVANKEGESGHIRFIAVSATIPNYKDIAEWLSTSGRPAFTFDLDEKYRPVKLDRVVMGYPFKEGTSDFRFDMNLSYRLRAIIENYSTGKSTLIFCSSRKSVIQTAETLAKNMKSPSLWGLYSNDMLQRAANIVHEHKLSELLRAGIGIHHAGLDTEDRHTVETLFKSSQLPILVSTSTLAMGVNLPAHLVVIKSTHFYNMGVVQEYSDMQILQMIGRAGRPQFDTSATAVIMTKMSNKSRYESLIKGTQLIESSLHKNLIEHLNAEIVLQTINDMALAVDWIKQTFLYVRVRKNAKHYGMPSGMKEKDIEQKLQDLCLKNLNLLTELNLVECRDDTYEIRATETGILMARYCIAYETMKHFHEVDGKKESIAELLQMLSECAEFEEIPLRTNEKRILNSLNHDKNKETIRFPLPGKIKTKSMKVNCLIQAQLSCLPVQDFSLSQDMAKIFRVGQRVAKCLMEFMFQGDNYSLLLHSLLTYKAFKTKLWFDSRYVARQLDGIGPTMSLSLANSGLSSFQKLEEANPRDIEMIVNRHPPFGDQLKRALAKLPKFELGVEQIQPFKARQALLRITVELANYDTLQELASKGPSQQAILLVGDASNKLVYKARISDTCLLREGSFQRVIEVKRISSDVQICISLLSQDWVGLDIQTSFTPQYTDGWFDPVKRETKVVTPSSKLSSLMAQSETEGGESCNHKCLDKSSCGHKCCKLQGFTAKRPYVQSTLQMTENRAKPERPVLKQTKDVRETIAMMNQHKETMPAQVSKRLSLEKFAFQKPDKLQNSELQQQKNKTTSQRDIWSFAVKKNPNTSMGTEDDDNTDQWDILDVDQDCGTYTDHSQWTKQNVNWDGTSLNPTNVLPNQPRALFTNKRPLERSMNSTQRNRAIVNQQPEVFTDFSGNDLSEDEFEDMTFSQQYVQRRTTAMDQGKRTMDIDGADMYQDWRAMDQGGRAMDQGGRAMNQGGRTMDQGGRAMDQGGRAMDQGGRAMDQGGRAMDQGGRAMNSSFNVRRNMSEKAGRSSNRNVENVQGQNKFGVEENGEGVGMNSNLGNVQTQNRFDADEKGDNLGINRNFENFQAQNKTKLPQKTLPSTNGLSGNGNIQSAPIKKFHFQPSSVRNHNVNFWSKSKPQEDETSKGVVKEDVIFLDEEDSDTELAEGTADICVSQEEEELPSLSPPRRRPRLTEYKTAATNEAHWKATSGSVSERLDSSVNVWSDVDMFIQNRQMQYTPGKRCEEHDLYPTNRSFGSQNSVGDQDVNAWDDHSMKPASTTNSDEELLWAVTATESLEPSLPEVARQTMGKIVPSENSCTQTSSTTIWKQTVPDTLKPSLPEVHTQRHGAGKLVPSENMHTGSQNSTSSMWRQTETFLYSDKHSTSEKIGSAQPIMRTNTSQQQEKMSINPVYNGEKQNMTKVQEVNPTRSPGCIKSDVFKDTGSQLDMCEINWSPQLLESSPSSTEALSQSSHRYGKVVAWTKSSQTPKKLVCSGFSTTSLSPRTKSQTEPISTNSNLPTLPSASSGYLQVHKEQDTGCVDLKPVRKATTYGNPSNTSKNDFATTTNCMAINSGKEDPARFMDHNPMKHFYGNSIGKQDFATNCLTTRSSVKKDPNSVKYVSSCDYLTGTTSQQDLAMACLDDNSVKPLTPLSDSTTEVNTSHHCKEDNTMTKKKPKSCQTMGFLADMFVSIERMSDPQVQTRNPFDDLF